MNSRTSTHAHAHVHPLTHSHPATSPSTHTHSLCLAVVTHPHTHFVLRYAVWLCYHPYYHCHSEHGQGDSVLCPDGHMKRPLFHLSVGLAMLMTGFFVVVVVVLVRGQTLRTILTDPDNDNPLAAHTQRGFLFCAEYRLGPMREWWRYLVPFTLGERSRYGDTTVS
eukprot:m.96954 g.96954  ORF g.96954 m.96954 type:complete len:166 (+) comp10192_c0_seq1:704-1201(+)